jgi:hypothetical protein
MLRALILQLGAISIFSFSLAYAEEAPNTGSQAESHAKIDGFQKAKFGAEFSDVLKLYPRATNKKKASRLASFEIQKLELAGKTGIAQFSFLDGKFYSVTVVFPISGTDENAYDTEFEKMLELLKKKYGEPGTISQPRRDIAGTDMTRLSLMTGQITWLTRWGDEKEKAVLTMAINGRNMGLIYTSNSEAKQVKKITDEQKASEL